MSKKFTHSPVAALAYALYDAEHTTRLGEHPEDLEEYFERARKLLFMLKEYRPRKERQAIIRAIR